MTALEAALQYASWGWHIIPCNGKIPLTQNGYKNATTDPDIIRAWFESNPSANIGIATGKISGFFVLDIDIKNGIGGDVSLSELEAQNGIIQSTVEAITYTGGRHIYFKYHDGIGCKAGLRQGIDIRGDGGYVVAPPSMIDGKAYQWEASSDPSENKLSDAPKWLIDLVSKPQKREQVQEKITENRNESLAYLGIKMSNAGVDSAAILTSLLSINKTRCVPPLDEDEVEKIAKSTSKYPVTENPVKTNGIKVISGGYYIEKKIGDATYPSKLSNFTIKIISSHHRDDGIYREVQLIREDGKPSSRKMLPPEDMKSESFQTFCKSIGNFNWFGSKLDMEKVWEYLFSIDQGIIVYEPECIGWQEDKNIFMFENIAFKDGEELRPDSHGTYWTGGVGIKPRSISASKSEVAEGLPNIVTNRNLDLELLRSKLRTSIEPLAADVCIGWAVSVFYMEEIFNQYGCFPFLFISGKRRSGKSTIAEWLTNLFGFESAGRMWSDTTPVAMSRYLGYYSSLPLWLDEYRNDSRYANKTGMLRNVYNRQSSGKGTRDGFTIREAKIRGTVIITGEETPDDSALLTRCNVVHISEKDRISNNFNWFTDNRRLLSNFSYQIMKNKHLNKDKYIHDLIANKDSLSTRFDDRQSINQAVVATGYSLIYGEDINFANALFDKTVADSAQQDDEAIIAIFFNDVAAMLFRKVIPSTYWVERDGQISIYFHGLYNEWAMDYRKRKGEAPFKRESIRKYLSDEPGFIDNCVNTRMQDGTLKSCVVFDVEKCSEYIKQLRSN